MISETSLISTEKNNEIKTFEEKNEKTLILLFFCVSKTRDKEQTFPIDRSMGRFYKRNRPTCSHCNILFSDALIQGN